MRNRENVAAPPIQADGAHHETFQRNRVAAAEYSQPPGATASRVVMRAFPRCFP